MVNSFLDQSRQRLLPYLHNHGPASGLAAARTVRGTALVRTRTVSKALGYNMLVSRH